MLSHLGRVAPACGPVSNAGERKIIRISDPAAATQAARLIEAAPGDRLTERESKAILDLYGIPTVREISADSADSAVAAAARLGFPLALKVESPDIAHKTEAGGVALNVRSDAELRAAYDRILANARAFAPQARINGVLLQPMVPAGIEVVAGVRVDPLLGPLIVVGFGGVLVELLRDSAVDLAPVNAEEASRMLRKLKGSALFDGFRGAPAVDLHRLADIIVRVSEFAADQQDKISEVDINPIICSDSQQIAVDALIVRAYTPPSDTTALEGINMTDDASKISRRDFTALSLAAGVAAATSASGAAAADMVDTDVVVTTADGSCDAALIHPKGKGQWPGVILFVDVFGLRPDHARHGQATGGQRLHGARTEPVLPHQQGARTARHPGLHQCRGSRENRQGARTHDRSSRHVRLDGLCEISRLASDGQ